MSAADERDAPVRRYAPEPGPEAEAPYPTYDPPMVSGQAVSGSPTWTVGGPGLMVQLQATESRITKVARVVGIIRDVLFILLVVGFLILGGRLVAGLQGGVDPRPVAPPTVPAPLPCDDPIEDEFGTYCPITPGG